MFHIRDKAAAVRRYKNICADVWISLCCVCVTENNIHASVGLLNRNTPDPAQESQGDGYSKSMVQALSAVCVRSPHYGTRSVSSINTKPLFPPHLFRPEVTDGAAPACSIIENC